MPDRTQLNINISPELLKVLKQNAIKSGTTLSKYVTQLIKVYVSNDKSLEDNDSVDSRIDTIENQLREISSKLSGLNFTSNEIKHNEPTKIGKVIGFTKEGAILFSKAVSEEYLKECKDRNISTQEAVSELIPIIQSTFAIKYWGPVIEMLATNQTKLNSELMFDVYTEHNDKCPFIELFYKWTGKKSKIIDEHLRKASIV